MYKYKLKKPRINLFDPVATERILTQEGKIAMDSSLIEIQNEVIKETPVGVAGDLRSSIGTELFITGGFFQGVVFAGKKYALPLNFGRKASPVSVIGQQSLARWVEKSTAGQELFAALKSKYPKITPRAVAFLIARKKKTKRTKGTKFFDNGVSNALPEVRRLFTKMGIKLKKELIKVT